MSKRKSRINSFLTAIFIVLSCAAVLVGCGENNTDNINSTVTENESTDLSIYPTSARRLRPL